MIRYLYMFRSKHITVTTISEYTVSPQKVLVTLSSGSGCNISVEVLRLNSYYIIQKLLDHDMLIIALSTCTKNLELIARFEVVTIFDRFCMI